MDSSGRKYNPLAVTNIGHPSANQLSKKAKHEAALREQMKQSATIEMHRSKANHPSRSNLHMQKFYPDTLSRLNNGELTRVKTPAQLKKFTWNTPFEAAQQKSNIDMNVTRRTVDISRWNASKRSYNQSRATNAEVDKIISGQGFDRNRSYPLFPANATHQELLGIDGKLVGANPDIPAPVPKRNLRWLGDSLGWENNRGLPAERKEFEDGHIEKWPNPKNWVKRPGPLL